MLTEKNWPPEAVVRLLIWLFASVMLGALAVSLLFPGAGDASPDRRLWSMILGTLAFHGSAIVCVALFVKATGRGWAEGFGFRRTGSGRSVLLGALACIGILPIVLLLGQLSAHLMTSVDVDPVPQTSVQAIHVTQSFSLKIYFGLVAVLVAPVAEELLFRGVLYPAIKERGYPLLALFGVSLFFAATHANVMTFVPLTVLALLLTKLYEHTGNLLAPITTHALFNLANFVWLLLGKEPRF